MLDEVDVTRCLAEEVDEEAVIGGAIVRTVAELDEDDEDDDEVREALDDEEVFLLDAADELEDMPKRLFAALCRSSSRFCRTTW